MTLTPEDAKVGFVGLGNLGQPMARALLRDGWQVTVLDRDPARAEPCRADGAQVAASPADLAACDVVAIAVPDDTAVRQVLDGLFGALRRGAAVVVHSTVLPATAVELAAEAERRGLLWVDAPVSGGAERALDGDLTVMVGADPDALAATRRLLEAVGRTVVHVGPPGAGEAVKLANQLVMFAALAGLHEALELAAANGVGPDRVLEVLATGTGDTWVGRNWGFFDRVAVAYDAGGTPVADRPWRKDLAEVVAAGAAAGLDLPVAAVLHATLAARVEEHAHRGGQG